MYYLLGMDMGTTNMKGILFRGDGTVVASASRTYPTHFDGPCAEQDPRDWWKAAKEIFSEIMAVLPAQERPLLRSICISSQTPTLLPVDYNGQPLRRAIIWMDKRAKSELDEILSVMGPTRYTQITGAKPDVSFLPAKLLWFRRNEPVLFRKTARILQVNAYINFLLTGQMTMDRDQASLTQCLDYRSGVWSAELANLLQVDFDRLLPAPVAANTVIGSVTPQAAVETGLPVGTPVCAGTSDAIAAMYASGISRLGEAAEISGTSSLVFAGTERLPATGSPVGAQRCTLPGVPYMYNAPISASGASVKWFLDTLGAEDRQLAAQEHIDVYTAMNREALTAKPGAGGVFFHPYLMGERAPLWNTHARGMFIGMQAGTTHADLARAVFEGTAFALRHVIFCFEQSGTPVTSLRVVGGGAKSETWLRIKAAVLNVPVLIPSAKTGDVPFGDALIAGQAVGAYRDLAKTMREMISIERRIDPDPDWCRVYNARYPHYLKLYEALDAPLRELESATL